MWKSLYCGNSSNYIEDQPNHSSRQLLILYPLHLPSIKQATKTTTAEISYLPQDSLNHFPPGTSPITPPDTSGGTVPTWKLGDYNERVGRSRRLNHVLFHCLSLPWQPWLRFCFIALVTMTVIYVSLWPTLVGRCYLSDAAVHIIKSSQTGTPGDLNSWTVAVGRLEGISQAFMSFSTGFQRQYRALLFFSLSGGSLSPNNLDAKWIHYSLRLTIMSSTPNFPV